MIKLIMTNNKEARPALHSMRRTLSNHGAGNTFIAPLSPCFAHVLVTTTCLLCEGDGQGLLAPSTPSDFRVTESLPSVCKGKIYFCVYI